MNIVKKAALGLALGATALAAAAPANAQRWGGYRGGYHGGYYGGYHGGGYGYRGYGYRGYRGDGTAVVAGIAGLAIGAAIASNNNRRYDYDRGYYRDRGYYPADGYYYREYERRGWYGCDVRRVWDPYIQQRVLIRYCD
jgi:hypothetical protein